MTKKYEIKTLEDMIYYLQYTGDMNGVTQKFNTTENIIKTMLLPTVTYDGFVWWANVHDVMKCLNQSDAEWMQYLSKSYNKQTVQGVKYYLDYTGDIDGVLKEFHLRKEALIAILLSHYASFLHLSADTPMQGIIDKIRQEYPHNSFYTGKISEVSTVRDMKNYLKFTDDIDGLCKKFDTAPDIIKVLAGSCPDSLTTDRDIYGNTYVKFILNEMQRINSSIEMCLGYLHIDKYRYDKSYLYTNPLSKIITMEDLMYYVAYTGDIDGLAKKFSTTPDILKSIIWNYSKYRLLTDKNNNKKNDFAGLTIKNWQAKFEQGFDMFNAGISSVVSVNDMRMYLEITGDMEGLVKKFGISEEEIEDIIIWHTLWLLDLSDEVQPIAENIIESHNAIFQDEEDFVDWYESSQEHLISLAWGRMFHRDEMCKVGLRRLRKFLKKKYKQEKDRDARIYRLAMDIEDKAIMINGLQWSCTNIPEDKQGEAEDKMKEQKYKLIRKLISYYQKSGYEYGIKRRIRDWQGEVYVIFELPNKKQIEFGIVLSDKEMEEFPEYKGEWRSYPCDTLDLIEYALLAKYPVIKARAYYKKKLTDDYFKNGETISKYRI